MENPISKYLRSLDNLKLILAIGIAAVAAALGLVFFVAIPVAVTLFAPLGGAAAAIAGLVAAFGGGYLTSRFVARPAWEAYMIVKFDQTMQRAFFRPPAVVP